MFDHSSLHRSKQPLRPRIAPPSLRSNGAGFLCVAALLTTTGCFGPGMEGIDSRAINLLEERSREINANFTPAMDAPSSINSANIRSSSPATVNPRADQLSFNQADADRAVAQRLASYREGADASIEPIRLGFEEVLRYAQQNSREFRSAEESYITAALQVIIQRHLFSPRFFDDVSADLTSAGDNARFQSAVSVLNNFRATQQLPLGGSISAQWLYSLTQQLRDSATGSYQQSSSLIFSGNIPLLRGAGLVASESRIQAERNLVYAARSFERFRRTFLVSIAQNYFNLLETRSNIENQERRLERERFLLERTLANVAAGRLAAFEEALVRNQLRTTEASLENSRESYRLQLERFRIRLALSPDHPLDLKQFVLALPEPDITPDDAAQRAIMLRLDLQNARDQLDDSRRSVLNAENNLLPDLDLSGSVTIPTDRDRRVGGLGFEPDDATFNIGLDLSIPLDRRIERTNLRQAQIALARAERNYEEFRDNVIVEARQSVRAVELARFQFALAEERVEINRQRLEEQRLKIDEIDPQRLLDTENDLVAAETARDSARTGLRNAVLRYLVDTGQMRVTPEGAFQPPAGAITGSDDPALDTRVEDEDLPDGPADALPDTP